MFSFLLSTVFVHWLHTNVIYLCLALSMCLLNFYSAAVAVAAAQCALWSLPLTLDFHSDAYTLWFLLGFVAVAVGVSFFFHSFIFLFLLFCFHLRASFCFVLFLSCTLENINDMVVHARFYVLNVKLWKKNIW